MQNDGDGKRSRALGNRNEGGDGKVEGETSSGKPAEQSTKPPPDPPKQDYIHVRARRGQATDSHSLAERVISLFLERQLNWGLFRSMIESPQPSFAMFKRGLTVLFILIMRSGFGFRINS